MVNLTGESAHDKQEYVPLTDAGEVREADNKCAQAHRTAGLCHHQDEYEDTYRATELDRDRPHDGFKVLERAVHPAAVEGQGVQARNDDLNHPPDR